MKRLINKLVRKLWLISAPVHGPIIRKFDRHMLGLLHPFYPDPEASAKLDLASSSVVRELARLQIQIEILQQQIEDLESSIRDTAGHERRLSVVGEIG
jgi:hypothetical protein